MENHLDELHGTSDYPKDHFLYSQENKKVVGKMKEECARKPISETVCLRSKMYSILVGGNNRINIKKAKGTTKEVTSKEVNHQNYKYTLFNKKTFKHNMSTLRSEGHKILFTRSCEQDNALAV